MILIADSGSTKTDWCVVREGRSVRRFETDGTNPFFQAPEQIERTLVSQLLPRLDGRPVRSVFFYGAGCAFEEQTAMIRRVLRSLLDVRRVEVGSDMLAAARALADLVGDDLSPDYIVPAAFDPRVCPAVAKAVAEAARATGVARA